MHYGVWEFGVKARLPQRRGWLPIGWKLTRAVQHAARDATTVHLVIDAVGRARGGPVGHALGRAAAATHGQVAGSRAGARGDAVSRGGPAVGPTSSNAPALDFAGGLV